VASRTSGFLIFLEDPETTAGRWKEAGVSTEAARAISAAIHLDLLQNLAHVKGVKTYLAALGTADVAYVRRLAADHGFEFAEVPEGRPLERWDSALSILHNRHIHPKVMCADGHVPDLYAEDVQRAQQKLDLYQMVIGREGEDRCWIIGMNGHQEFLSRAEVRPDDSLHPILQAAGEAGINVAVLDTKHAARNGLPPAELHALARRPQHRALARALAEHSMAPPRASRA
jgi:hypothetical protein